MSDTNNSDPHYKLGWAEWRQFKALPLWKAVVLATGFDPDVTGWSAADIAVAGVPDGGTRLLPREVIDLIGRADTAFSAGILRVSPLPATPSSAFEPIWLEGEVNMSEFTSWLLSIGHALPNEFPWMPSELSAGALVWPWGKHSTNDLALLARAAMEFWKTYDPKHPRTAPKNDAVVAWLKKQGMGARKAEVVASLLRPDDLPSGPRTK